MSVLKPMRAEIAPMSQITNDSPFWLGGAGLGNSITAISDDEARSTVETAWALGVRAFDTAPHYGLGISEIRLGEVLSRMPRSEFTLSTKVGWVLEPGPGDGLDDQGFIVSNDRVRRYDASADGVHRSLDESLGRLGLERVDVLYLHDPERVDLQAALRTALPVMAELREAGRIDAVGIGSGSIEAHSAALETGLVDIAMLSGRFTLLDQSGRPFLDDCAEAGVSVVAASVFNSGILSSTRPPDDAFFDYEPAAADVINRARVLADLSARYGVTLPQLAFAYAERHPAVSAVALGAQSPEHVSQNVANASVTIPSRLWRDVDAFIDSGSL